MCRGFAQREQHLKRVPYLRENFEWAADSAQESGRKEKNLNVCFGLAQVRYPQPMLLAAADLLRFRNELQALERIAALPTRLESVLRCGQWGKGREGAFFDGRLACHGGCFGLAHVGMALRQKGRDYPLWDSCPIAERAAPAVPAFCQAALKISRVQRQQPGGGHTVWKAVHVVLEQDSTMVLGSGRPERARGLHPMGPAPAASSPPRSERCC